MSPELSRALSLADEYRRLVDRGDVALAGERRRTIEDLVGVPLSGGCVVLPRSVREAMGVRT